MGTLREALMPTQRLYNIKFLLLIFKGFHTSIRYVSYGNRFSVYELSIVRLLSIFHNTAVLYMTKNMGNVC